MMRPGRVSACIDHVTYMGRQKNRRVKRLSSKGGSKNMLVDHLFQYRISPWPKTAEKRSFRTCVTDIPTDGPTDGQTLL